jgi:drug/metabolite transporter (DMT)-like permease
LNALADVSTESSVVETAQAASAASPAGLALAFAPVGIYSLFWIYREKVDPRAKISDLLFFVGAVVIVGNIVSILVFKKRIY